uniref:Uncharacterized protein n=1 Tax=Acrobeloides nanus TaxID=290746 RepID=A0A914CXY8_9BILA
MNHEATFDGKHRPNPHAPYRSRSRFVMPAPDPAGNQDAGRLANHQAITYTLDGRGGLGGLGPVVRTGSYIPGSTVNHNNNIK